MICSPPGHPRSWAQLVASRPPPSACGPARRAPGQEQVIKAERRQPSADPRCARRIRGRDAPGMGRGPGPGIPQRSSPQRSSPHPRPRPVLLQSPPRSLNPPQGRRPRLHRKQDPDPPPSRDPRPELARPLRLDQRREPNERPHSRPSRRMPSLCPATRTRVGPASSSQGHLVLGPLPWGLDGQQTSGRRRLPPSELPGFGSWRKVNRVPEADGTRAVPGRKGRRWV